MNLEAKSWLLTLTKEDILELIHEQIGDVNITDIDLAGDGVIIRLESSE